MAHVRQSKLDASLRFQVRVLKTIQVVSSSLGSGLEHMSVLGRDLSSTLNPES